MMTFGETPSLLVAQAVTAMFKHFVGDGSESKKCDIHIGTSVVGRQHAYCFVDDMNGKVAWVYQHHVTPDVIVKTGRSSDNSYIYDDSYHPNKMSATFTHPPGEVYEAARTIYNFFNS